MATVQQIDGDVMVRGTLTATSGLSMPDGTVTNAKVNAAAAIAATKLQHQHAISYYQADGSAIVAAIVPVHIVYGATATVVAFEIVCVDAPSGGDLHFTVDLLKANEGTPTPATILSAVIDSDTAGAGAAELADCEVGVGTLASPTLADGDTLIIQTAVAGSTGTQGQGLICIITLQEDAA